MFIVWLSCSYLTYPLLIVNKYVFCKLTDRPFVWLATYTADLMLLACFLYVFGWHVVWINEKNDAFGLASDPEQAVMYAVSYANH